MYFNILLGLFDPVLKMKHRKQYESRSLRELAACSVIFSLTQNKVLIWVNSCGGAAGDSLKRVSETDW